MPRFGSQGFLGLKIPMVMISDLSEVVMVRSGEIRRLCSHIKRSQEAKIWVTKVFGHENSNGHGLGPV